MKERWRGMLAAMKYLAKVKPEEYSLNRMSRDTRSGYLMEWYLRGPEKTVVSVQFQGKNLWVHEGGFDD